MDQNNDFTGTMLASEQSAEKPNKKKTSTAKEIGRFLLIIVFVVLPIRLFIAQPFIVSGDSMVPTMQTNEYLIIDQISYRFDDPKRGDVIVFRYPNDPSRFFIKRIIGLPNETIVFEDTNVIIKNEDNPRGFTLEEPYIDDLIINNNTYRLYDDEYFVMGDNRKFSSDSRFWGSLEEEFIVGRALYRILPWDKRTKYPGDYKDYQ